MIPRGSTFKEHWQEWFHGVNGGPSIWRLDNAFGNDWRKGNNTVAKLYLFKKQLIESGLRIMLTIEASSLQERQFKMFEHILEEISKAGSLNQYYENLPKGRPRGPVGPRPRKDKNP